MAATRLIALHIGKGKDMAKALNARLDYSQNPDKTDGGELISSYECSPETAAEEFLLSKKKYYELTGRTQQNDVTLIRSGRHSSPERSRRKKQTRSVMNWPCALQKAVMLLRFRRISIKHTFTTTSFSIRPPWTARGNSGTSNGPAWPCRE